STFSVVILIIVVVFFIYISDCLFLFFFFQAEDGIRDSSVTGVQTCALPISRTGNRAQLPSSRPGSPRPQTCGSPPSPRPVTSRRSEERRVGKECRSRWAQDY